MKQLRIATRKSRLALWQAEHVADLLKTHHPKLKIEFVKLTTEGDRILDIPLAKIGGKGLFLKELQTALLNHSADIAVHSMKDVPVQAHTDLAIQAILKRATPFDALVTPLKVNLMSLPQQARIGTASLRRQCQLLAQRPDLQISSVRGNVETRLKKLDENKFDALILAGAGLQRLGYSDCIQALLSEDECLPAVGQGAIGIETRREDTPMIDLIAPLNDTLTADCVRAERAMSRVLGGSCQVPLAGFATLQGQTLHLRAKMGTPDGKTMIMDEIKGKREQAETLGATLGQRLLARGADAIIAAL